MLGGIHRVLGSFVIIAVLTLLHCTNADIAGENTPVWIARCIYSVCSKATVTYEKLETGAVKRAFQYLHSGNFSHLRPRRDIQTLEDLEQNFSGLYNSGHLARRDTEVQDEYDHDVEDEPLPGNGTGPSGLSTGINTVQILAVSQYDANEVIDSVSQEKYINEKILYMLAYWRMFNGKVLTNRKITNFSHPRVKIVGIIIALNRGATPYLKPDSGTADYIKDSSYKMDALSDSNDYWNSPPAEFSKKTFHAVVTMTDIRPLDERVGYMDCVSTIRAGSGTVMVWDTTTFRAVRERATMSGLRQCVNTLYSFGNRQIEFPNDMKPGRPVTVFPGQLFPPEVQCKMNGYRYLSRLCPEYSEHCEIWCLDEGIFQSCGSIGRALEGTPCKNGKVG